MSKAKRDEFKMGQNNVTELLSIPFPQIYYKNDPTNPKNWLHMFALIMAILCIKPYIVLIIAILLPYRCHIMVILWA